MRGLLWVCFGLSGAAALAFEMLWMRSAGLVLGDDRSDCRNRSCLLFCWAGAWRRLCAAGLVSARVALRLSRNRRSRRGALVSRGFLDTHTGHRAGLAF